MGRFWVKLVSGQWVNDLIYFGLAGQPVYLNVQPNPT
jgi:hypothetical protein